MNMMSHENYVYTGTYMCVHRRTPPSASIFISPHDTQLLSSIPIISSLPYFSLPLPVFSIIAMGIKGPFPAMLRLCTLRQKIDKQ